MADYKPSQVLSIRIDPDLLEAVRERASAEGRSVSGEIVFMVREQLGATATRREPARPITGWLANLSAPKTHAEFREARADASAALTGAIGRKASRASVPAVGAKAKRRA